MRLLGGAVIVWNLLVLAATTLYTQRLAGSDGSYYCNVDPAPFPDGADLNAYGVAEFSRWPIGFSCTYDAASGGTVTVGPDYGLSLVYVGGIIMVVLGVGLIIWGTKRKAARASIQQGASS